jgi:CHAT domain-containing protein/tetratricopeptide (TPR) repeat protein
METSPINSSSLRLFVCVFVCLLSSPAARSQQTPAPKRYIPPELQASDQEIRQLLTTAESKSEAGEYESAFTETKAALELAEKKGLLGDRAIAEESVASGYFALGKLDESISLYQASLQHAIDSANVVLQADVLVALSTLPQLRGDLPEALELLGRAQERANQSKNPYIRTRVLGELGRLQIASGEIEQGRKSVEEALKIDRVNSYNFEPLHSVYSAYATLSQPRPDIAKAISQLESARDLAIEKDNYIALVQAQNTLGAIYVSNGDVPKGIATLETTLKGTILRDGQIVQMPEAFRQAANLPFMKATMLEGLAQGYEAAHESDKALQTWNQLYLLSSETGFNLTLAESASKMAIINFSEKHFPDALKYFGIATQTWRILQNNQQLSQNLTGEALLLIQLGRGESAIPLETEVADIEEKTQNRIALFTAYGIMAEIYQPIGKFQEARSMLERATALIRPGPADSEIDSKAVVEDYIFLADDYKALQLPIKELITLEKEVAVLQTLKDTESLQQALTYLKGRFETLQVEDVAAAAAQDGRLADSLWYSEILYVWSGVRVDAAKDENWNRLFNLPLQIVQQPNGPQALDEILGEMGSILGIARLPILESLSSHFLTSDLKPTLAERYASEAESVARQAPNPSDALIATPVCQLAVAYANEGKADPAKRKLDECMALAEKANDPQSRVQASTANTFVHLWANDLGAAEDSLKYLLTNDPENFYFHLDLAIALVKKDQYEKGVEEFKRAIKIMEDKKDVNSEAAAFVQIASALGAGSSEHKLQQLEYLKSAEAKYKQAMNPSGTATVDIEIGTYYQNAGDQKDALKYFQQAEVSGQAPHASQLSARAALLAGSSYNSIGDYRNAVIFHRRASATYHEIGDSNLEAVALLFVGEDLRLQKDFDSALRSSLEAEGIASRSSTPVTRYWIQKTLEQLYYQEGEFDKALTSAQSAVQFATAAGDKRTIGQAYIVLAGLCEILGQWEDAATFANKAVEIFKVLKDTQGLISAYAELSSIYGDRTSSFQDFDKAKEYYSEATKLGANIQSDLIEIYSQAGHLSDAINAAKAAIQDCIKNKNVECQASGLTDLAEVERKNGDLAAAASSLKEARRLSVGIKDVYFQGSLLYREAGQLRAEGHLDQALKSYQELISLIERVKGQGDIKLQRSLAETYGYIYDELSSTLYAMSAGKSDPDRTRLASLALEYSETNKAREFANSWGRTFVTELRRILPSDLQEKERSLLAKRDQLRTIAEGNEPKSNPDSVEKEMASFVDGLRLTHPQFAAIAYPQPITLDSIPLREGETLVEFKVTDESTLVWIIRKVAGDKVELVDFYQVLKPRKWLEERFSNLRSALNSGQRERIEQIDWHNSEELFNELFPGSISKTLLESKSIVFVPDDVLSVLPLELLSPDASKMHFPLLSIPTTYYPSAAALQLARTARHVESWQEAFLGIGDPITSPEDVRYALAGVLSAKHGEQSESAVNPAEPELGAIDLARMTSRGLPTERLPETATEVMGIATLFQNQGQTVEVRLGSNATKDRLTDTDLTKFRYLHFATHGLLPADSNIPEPALLLSYDGSSSEHMLLSMSEILGLKIHADTVVLSACNTGSGKVMHAEGVMSLGRAFMAAGAESVTVSLWQVSDESTQMLMEEYYKNLIGGKSKAEALSIARSYLFDKDKQFTNPFFWAPFILIGD